jgi:2-polyprenyl-3-methyl-5-hydroxy-6-metoxy-1,4-benzoquinol methylase
MSSPRPVLLDQRTSDLIRFRPCPACYLCGATGELFYEGLTDRLYGAPGTWNLKRCPKPGCELIWLDPMPVEEDIGNAYKNYFTHVEGNAAPKSWPKRAFGWAKKGYWARKYGYGIASVGRWQKFFGMAIQLHPGRQAELDFTVLYLPSRQNGLLLDIGCGSGQAMRNLAELGWRVHGVDFDPRAVQIARKKGLNVRLGNLTAQDYPSDYFDAITMSHVIEHVHDPLSLLDECRRILKPGAHLVIVTPNSGSWGHHRFKANWMHLDPPRHLHVFNGQNLRKLVEGAGFQLVSSCTTIRDANGLFLGSRSIARTGEYPNMAGQFPPTLPSRLGGCGRQFAEWVLMNLKPDLGEEIALVGAKPLRLPS